jgi:hypothetical protein
VVFGFWAMVLVVAMALVGGGAKAIAYLESRNFTEPMFVFVIMVIAASRPCCSGAARWWSPSRAGRRCRARCSSLCLALVPLLGSLITEPAAMTLAALMLRDRWCSPRACPERLKYARWACCSSTSPSAAR